MSKQVETEPLVHRPWKGPCATTGLTLQEFIDRLDGVSAGPPAKRAAIRICRAFGIVGWADPGYIANVIQDELGK